jgi:hypothetical protein
MAFLALKRELIELLVTTKDGALQIKIERVDDPSTNHNMSYKSGMVSSTTFLLSHFHFLTVLAGPILVRLTVASSILISMIDGWVQE